MTAHAGDPQISELRDETIAAIQQRDRLAAEARRALIAAWEEGWICRTGCAEALTGWGLELPPGELTMSADGQMSYARMHHNEDEAREEARHHVPEELDRLLPEDADIWPTRVVGVALIPGEDDRPAAQPYRITVQVCLRVPVTASSLATACTAAETRVNAWQAGLADAGITFTGLSWQVYDGPADLIDAAGIDAQPATVSLAAAEDDLAAATAARDAATAALADLRRKIRHRAVTALAAEEIGGEPEETAKQVERFLLDLGFDPLPRAHLVAVIVDMTVRVHAATTHDAYGRVRDLMAPTGGPGEQLRLRTAHGWGTGIGEVDGWWQVTWQHRYDMWLRDQPDRATAATAAEALIRGELDRTLAGVEHQLVLTCAVEGYGIDQRLDPDTD